MQKNICWEGIAYHSLENCLMTITGEGPQIRSVIVGVAEGMIYQVNYTIVASKAWETRGVEISTRAFDKITTIKFQKEGAHWFENGAIQHQFDGCTEVDIVLTPFTNTLPIKRLHRLTKRTRIKVIYFDVLEHRVYAVEQYYTKLSATVYKFEQPRDNFEAVITTDDDGLVKDYPGLFRQYDIRESNYLL